MILATLRRCVNEIGKVAWRVAIASHGVIGYQRRPELWQSPLFDRGFSSSRPIDEGPRA
jgi:hypothetical protein